MCWILILYYLTIHYPERATSSVYAHQSNLVRSVSHLITSTSYPFLTCASLSRTSTWRTQHNKLPCFYPFRQSCHFIFFYWEPEQYASLLFSYHQTSALNLLLLIAVIWQIVGGSEHTLRARLTFSQESHGKYVVHRQTRFFYQEVNICI